MIEADRLSTLNALRILDSDPEPFFDALTQAARTMTGMPIALISLVDGERQWFKSQTGLPGVKETPRDISFCTWSSWDQCSPTQSFRSFTRVGVKGTRLGLGIGLALVKKILEQHGGSVQARSKGLGKGSQFVARFPTRVPPSPTDLAE